MTESMISYEADHYVQRLDLGEDPFSTDFEPDYFYAGANRQALLDQLIHFSRFSKQAVLLLGATGSGSSCLLDKAYFALREVMDCCYLDAEVIKQEQEIIDSLSSQLQLGVSEEASLPELVMAIQSVALVDGEPEPILLAVDQAHFLSLESYSLLRELVSAGDNLIRLMLAGEYQVEQLAMLAGFSRDTFKRFELEPLSRHETGEYLLGLLHSVGYAGELPLSGDQLAVLHEQSGGNIADINQLAPKLLMPEGEAERGAPRLAIPVAHIAAIAILALAVVGAWIYQGQNKSVANEAEPAAAKPEVPARSSQPLSLPALVENPVTDVTQTEEAADAREGRIERDAPETAAQARVAEEPAAPVTENNVAARTAEPKRQPAQQEGESIVRQERLVNTELAAKVPAITEAVGQEQATTGLAKKEPRHTAANTGSDVAAKVIDKKQRVEDAKPATVAGPSTIAEVSPPTIPGREQKLLALPQSGYVLQLMGALEEQRAQSFVQKYADQLPVTYFETRLKGKPWFVAVTGPYEDKDQALAGIKQLPASLQKQRPWARTVASVQSDIRGNRQ